MKKILFLVGLIFFWSFSVQAYFMIPIQEKDKGYGMRGKTVTWILFRGEPFQGIIYDLKPPKAFINTPDHQTAPVTLSRIQIKDYQTGLKRYAFLLTFTPIKKGDHYLCLISQEHYLPELNEVWQEFTKVPLHVEEESSWDRPVGLKLEIIPLIRPYGLMSGQIFRGKLLYEDRPAPGVLIQITRYHGVFIPRNAIPRDAFGNPNYPLMYLSVKTDENGYFSVSLNQPGWWLISARMPHGYTNLGLQRLPLIIRGSLWVYITPRVKPSGQFPKISPIP